jgi:integrase
MLRESEIKNNPAASLIYPRLEKILPKFLTEEDVKRILNKELRPTGINYNPLLCGITRQESHESSTSTMGQWPWAKMSR